MHLDANFTICPSTRDDLSTIQQRYAEATALQANKGMTQWPVIDEETILRELDEGRQWKLQINGEMACVWVVAYEDPLIWGERGHDLAVYLHRIATAPAHRGQGLVAHIVAWAREQCQRNGLRYIRLDTVGYNPGLIKHYTSHGFTHLGPVALASTEGLPGHYNDGDTYLFEIDLNET